MAQTTGTSERATRGRPRPSVERARAMGRLLDDAFRVPGTGFRIGLDPILGVVPYVGDGVASIGSLYIVFVGFRLGLPRRVIARMLAYVALDFFLGSVPLIGSVVDAVVKVNRRNVALVEAHAPSESA